MTQLVADIEIGSTEWRGMVETARTLTGEKNWTLGDMALRLVPIGTRGGAPTGSLAKLEAFADEAEVSFGLLREARRVSTQWPNATRVALASWGAHRELAAHPDRFRLLQPGMLRLEARSAAGKSTSSLDRDRGVPAPTVLSLQTELGSSKRRLRRIHEILVAMDPSDEQKIQLIEYATEVADEADLIKEFLIGQSIASMLADIGEDR